MEISRPSDKILSIKLQQHVERLDNPHHVTKGQIGLGKVQDIAPENMPLSTPQKEYVDTFLKTVEVKQDVASGDVYINVFDGNGKIVSRNKIIVPGAESVAAKYDSLGNIICDSYASEFQVVVDEAGDSYACLISNTGKVLSRQQLARDVSISSVELDENYVLKLIKSNGEELECDLSVIYTDLVSYVDAEIKKLSDKISEDITAVETSVDALSERVADIEADYLTSDDKSTIESKLAEEETRAKAAEQKLEEEKVAKTDYNAKITALETADAALDQQIKDEKSARETAVNDVASDLSQFKTTVFTKTETENKIDEKIAAIDISDKLKEVKDEIEAETTRAETAEKGLQDNIDSLDSAKQDKLTAGDNIKIENNVISSTGVDEKYVDDKVKEYVDEKLPEIKKEFEDDLKILSDKIDAEAKDRSEADTALSENKQDKIDDLDVIRSGAASGATAVQPGDLTDYVKTDDARLSDARTPVAHNHAVSDITDLDQALEQKAAKEHTHTKSDITDFPTSMPASDVYDWAKEENKPTYTHNEVGAAAEDHNHDTEYSKLEHNHDDKYSKLGHNHDDIYAAQEHTHDQYLEESDLDGYATEQWVESKGYLTEHQDISGKADKADTYTKTDTDTKISEHHDSSKQDLLTPGKHIKIENNEISVDMEIPDVDKEKVQEWSKEVFDENIVPVTTELDKKIDASEVYTQTQTDSKLDTLKEDLEDKIEKAIENSIIFEQVASVGDINFEVENKHIYALTAKTGISSITASLPETITPGYSSEITYYGYMTRNNITIVPPNGMTITYKQHGLVQLDFEVSQHMCMSMLFEYDGLKLVCYVNEY